MMERW